MDSRAGSMERIHDRALHAVRTSTRESEVVGVKGKAMFRGGAWMGATTDRDKERDRDGHDDATPRPSGEMPSERHELVIYNCDALMASE